MYQIVIHSPDHQKHLVFAAETRSEAERQAAHWCLIEQRTALVTTPDSERTTPRLQALWCTEQHQELIEAFLEANREVQVVHAGPGVLVVGAGLKDLKRWAHAQLQTQTSHQMTLPDVAESHSRAG